jgi:hypothetical protein
MFLRPVAKFCLRHSLTIQDLIEACKVVALEIAADQIKDGGEKVNVSRLSVMTGLHRRDVMRIYREGETNMDQNSGIASRVLGQWEQDSRFTTKANSPRILKLSDEEGEFKHLVSLVSKDINPGTVLFELERIGAVERHPRGIKLVKRHFVTEGDPFEGYTLAAKDADDMLEAVGQNVVSQEDVPNLHGRTEYDNISKKDLPQIKKWLLDEGSAFHQRARTFLSRFDKDINSAIKGEGGGKVVVGTFSRTIGEK